MMLSTKKHSLRIIDVLDVVIAHLENGPVHLNCIPDTVLPVHLHSIADTVNERANNEPSDCAVQYVRRPLPSGQAKIARWQQQVTNSRYPCQADAQKSHAGNKKLLTQKNY